MGRTNRGADTVMLVEFFPSLTGMWERISLFTLELVIPAYAHTAPEYPHLLQILRIEFPLQTRRGWDERRS